MSNEGCAQNKPLRVEQKISIGFRWECCCNAGNNFSSRSLVNANSVAPRRGTPITTRLRAHGRYVSSNCEGAELDPSSVNGLGCT